MKSPMRRTKVKQDLGSLKTKVLELMSPEPELLDKLQDRVARDERVDLTQVIEATRLLISEKKIFVNESGMVTKI